MDEKSYEFVSVKTEPEDFDLINNLCEDVKFPIKEETIDSTSTSIGDPIKEETIDSTSTTIGDPIKVETIDSTSTSIVDPIKQEIFNSTNTSTEDVKPLIKHESLDIKDEIQTEVSETLEPHLQQHNLLGAGSLSHVGKQRLKYMCRVCGFNTSLKYLLKWHKNTFGCGKFKCNHCEYRSAEKSKLKRHMLTHFSVKPFKCNECDFATSLNKTLKNHLKMHTRDDQFKCDKCKYSAEREVDLQTHITRRHRFVMLNQ